MFQCHGQKPKTAAFAYWFLTQATDFEQIKMHPKPEIDYKRQLQAATGSNGQQWICDVTAMDKMDTTK